MTGNEVYFEENKVILRGKVITFEEEIRRLLIHGERIFILTNVLGMKINNRNIYCLNFSGNLLWQVESPKVDSEDCPFTELKLLEEDRLQAYNWCGYSGRIDLETGKFIEWRFTK